MWMCCTRRASRRSASRTGEHVLLFCFSVQARSLCVVVHRQLPAGAACWSDIAWLLLALFALPPAFLACLFVCLACPTTGCLDCAPLPPTLAGTARCRPDDYEKAKGKYIITPDTMKQLRKDAVVMHPLPRVDEVRGLVGAGLVVLGHRPCLPGLA